MPMNKNTYGYTVQSGGPVLDLMVNSASIGEVAEDYTIFIEAHDGRFEVKQRHTIPYVDIQIEVSQYGLIIKEIDTITQKNGKAAIPIFITTHDFKPCTNYDITVHGNYNGYSDTEISGFYLIEKSGKCDNIVEQEE